ncbi:Transposon Ty3-G Gag-Pol polyprotein,Transposon Ty3-I Gag-Pol polyprotein,Retrovirus-related Pol polyprotein from transposon 297 [Mytilus coruscus]|uniref:Transposon Ty3-G Gag-Pol polyprotein,Transposon Ty3-I Gag-Pol polyprotein,Retrovirus-related Pol polyprotein from transposon 297 n=1 Tax=Mytilus coruscus TaxID=42192 RepID=A0A6J8DL62_MYTCO|nr:Transposon Ty3-G Gag-Pol polyprotein,Transposon Ty3-I Gag-Pol polyprotein,Retrovirus-related Pol polyprotein from transposon 297 [Mytilus coruscus]
MIRKSDLSWRFCLDYRILNNITVKQSQFLPRIDDTLDALSQNKWFSTLDLKSGYHQLNLANEDRPKTAFSLPGGGLWQFTVLPFGLCNAPAVFEKLMLKVLTGLPWKTCLVYLDDIMIIGKTFEEHIKNLEEVMQRLRDANLKLNPKKCERWDFIQKWESNKTTGFKWLIVLSKELTYFVMEQLHNSVTGGHLGFKKTLSKVRERFTWYNQRKDVEQWCKCCNICASRKPPSKKPKAPLQQYNVGAPFERIGIDILGPLPKSTRGNKFLLVIGDYFTKWMEAFPSKIWKLLR